MHGHFTHFEVSVSCFPTFCQLVVQEISNKVNQVKEAFKDATPIERLVNDCKSLQLVMGFGDRLNAVSRI